MKLSAPIYQLKRRAKAYSRKHSIPLNIALDSIAAEEGFDSWSLLASKAKHAGKAQQLLAHLEPGQLMLLGAPRHHGKTQLAFELLARAQRSKPTSFFYTLEYDDSEISELIASMALDDAKALQNLNYDCSDAISADDIVRDLQSVEHGALIVIDYLQLLDRQRHLPPLQEQVLALKAFAIAKRARVVIISQIDRRFDASGEHFPGLDDVRLHNPLDLGLFDQRCFMKHGELNLEMAA